MSFKSEQKFDISDLWPTYALRSISEAGHFKSPPNPLQIGLKTNQYCPQP
jgi:hypothetical protein